MSRIKEVDTPGSIADTIDICDFIYENLDENNELLCPICRTGLVVPYTTQCGHTFCRDCIYAARSAAESSDTRFRCPIDRVVLTEDLQPAPLLVNSLVDDLIVRCPFSPRGCTFKGKRWLIDSHVMDDCQYVQVRCHYPCLKTVERRYFDTERCIHTEEDETPDSLPSNEIQLTCPGHTFGCKYEVSSENELESHASKCPLAILAPTLRAQASQLESLQTENKALRRQLINASRQAHREAAELDSHLMAEYDRLWQQLSETQAAREGHAKHLMVLARENVRMTEDMAFLRSSVDSLHRQLNLAILSQRRMSMYSSLSGAPSSGGALGEMPESDRTRQKL